MMATVEDRLLRERPGRRVLSIQSHVVSGYAGNKCSIFPLQLHGFEVDFINSVQFSNHTGYKTVKGQRLQEEDLNQLYQGLTENRINKYSHVLTGYCGNPTFLHKIGNVVTDLKSINPDLIFVCDPVLGDNGSYYAPKELMPIYRDTILPIADIITPNVFELSELAGIEISDESGCLKAISCIHEKYPNISIIVVTSGIFSKDDTQMFCYASRKIASDGTFQRCRFTIPLVRGQFVGTGDVFASLLVVWLDEFNGEIKPAVKNVIASLQALLRRTSVAAFASAGNDHQPTAAERELKLVESRLDLLVPNLLIDSKDI